MFFTCGFLLHISFSMKFKKAELPFERKTAIEVKNRFLYHYSSLKVRKLRLSLGEKKNLQNPIYQQTVQALLFQNKVTEVKNISEFRRYY